MVNIFSWIFSIIKEFKNTLIRVFFISLFLNLLMLAFPIVMMTITDRVIVYKGFNTLQILLIGLFILNLFEILLSYIRSYILAHTSLCITLETSVKIYEKLLSLKVHYFDNKPVGEIMNRLQEVHNIKDFLVNAPVAIVIDVIFAFVFLIVIFLIEPYLSLVVLLTIPVHIITVIIATKLREFYLNEQFKIAGINQSSMVETISSIQTVKLMSIESSLKNLWLSQTTQGADVSFKILKIESLAHLITSFFDKVSHILILYIGSKKVMVGDITFGTLLAFNSFSGYVINPLINLATVWKSIQQIFLSATRLQEIFKAPVEYVSNLGEKPITDIKGNITLTDVYFNYPTSPYYALNKINLKINAGEIIGITGSSGSGKSTITKLIQGLYLPTQGQILIDNYDLSIVSPREIRKFIGSVPQESFLFSRTIAQNIAIGRPDASIYEIKAAAKMAGINEFIESLPLKYDSVVEERGINFSGGQRQRIAIARSLLLNPRILIFDEATSALDYESEKVIHNNMKDIANNRTVIIISHRIEAFQTANRILVLSQGELIKEYKDIKLFFSEYKQSAC